MILYINTTNETTIIRLFQKNGILIDQKSWLCQKNQSEELLFEIDILLRKNSFNKLNIKSIVVMNNNGSYTGLRVGLSTANALAYSLDIPILASNHDLDAKNIKSFSWAIKKRFRTPVMPKYAYPPKITNQKHRPNAN